MTRWSRLGALAVLGAAVPLCLGPRASLPPPVFFLHDQQHYLAMANPETQPPADPRAAPFGWRLLPSAVVRATGLPARGGFHALTIVALALIPPVVAITLAAAGASASSAMLLAIIAALAPAVAGYLSWDFVRPDGPSLLLITLSAWAAIRARPGAFVLSIVALSLTKETWLVSAAFALVWARAYQPGFWKWAVAGTVLAGAVAAGVRIAIPATQPYSIVAIVRDLYWPLESRTMARRLLLATASTWNVMTPVIAVALARRIQEPRAWAVGVALLIASAQVLVAIDTQRIVAAAYPFVLLALAWELDRLAEPKRIAAGVLIAMAQLPWLLTYARIHPLPLRGVEIGIAAVAVAAGVYGFSRGRRLSASGAA